MVKIKKENVTPVCPFCEKQVEELVEVNRGWFKLNRVFCCPHCKKILGIAAPS